MPNIDTTNQTQSFNMTLEGAADMATYVNHSSTFYTYLSSGGHLITIYGSGFTINGANELDTGLINSVEFDLGNNNPGTPDMVITGVSISANNLFSFADDQESAQFLGRILSGETTTMPSLQFAGTYVGDFVRVTNGTSLYTGSDNVMSAENINNLYIVGDGDRVQGGLYLGGDDTITGSIDVAYGDFIGVVDRGVGGDDVITYTANWVADNSVEVFGDAYEIFYAGTLIGGDDVIDVSVLSGQPGINNLLGDVANTTVLAYLQGGDDLIHGSQSRDVIAGDVRDLGAVSALDGGDDTLFGNGGDDTIYGDHGATTSSEISGGDDLLDGGSGDDFLYGNSGDDTLIGGADADNLNGGGGSDWASYETATSAVRARLDGSTDMTSDALGDTFFDIDHLMGSDYNDTLIGNALANILDGGAGDDTLFGGGGNDTLRGGFGADMMHGQGGANDWASYITSNIGVGARLDGIAGFGGALGDRIFTVENIEGSLYDDTLVGNALGNVLRGLEGNDTIFASGGDDTVFGDGGNDLLYGQGGMDTLLGGLGDDTLIGGPGGDELNGQQGFDTASYINAGGGIAVRMDGSPGTVGVATGDELVNIEAVQGSNFADTIIGASRNDLIMGENGADALFGSVGNDTLIGGLGADTMNGQGGIDTASYAGASSGVRGRLDGIAGSGGEATGDMIFTVENLIGSGFDDTLIGNGLGNEIMGGNGNDTIFAANGNDTLTGGAGNDQLYGQAGLDTFIFANGFGDDRIIGFNANNGDEDIDLSGVSSIVSFVDLTSNGHMSQVGANVVINDFAGNTITLVNININTLDANDFLF